MDAIGKLTESLGRKAGGARQAQIRFAECVSVDWDGRTMDAKGTGDGVPYLDVALGFGYADIRPAVGSLCLIGIIDGQEVAAFLINAETVELVEIKAGSIVYNGGRNAGTVKVGKLTAKLNALERDLNDLKRAFAAWTPVPSDGGAALKGAAAFWAGKTFEVTPQPELENEKIKH